MKKETNNNFFEINRENLYTEEEYKELFRKRKFYKTLSYIFGTLSIAEIIYLLKNMNVLSFNLEEILDSMNAFNITNSFIALCLIIGTVFSLNEIDLIYIKTFDVTKEKEKRLTKKK